MATDAVPAQGSSDSIIQARWFRFPVRTALALLAFWTLWLAADRYHAFLLKAYANRRYDDSVWLSWAGATVAAGLLFGLAIWLPFAKIRFLPSRLLLAAVALLPLAHFWWVYNEGHQRRAGGWGTSTGSTGGDPVPVAARVEKAAALGRERRTPIRVGQTVSLPLYQVRPGPVEREPRSGDVVAFVEGD